MKKWQEWSIVAAVGVLIVGIVGAAYWYMTEEREGIPTVEAVQTAEEKDLASAEEDLQGINDLDLSSLDAIDADLQALDLSSL